MPAWIAPNLSNCMVLLQLRFYQLYQHGSEVVSIIAKGYILLAHLSLIFFSCRNQSIDLHCKRLHPFQHSVALLYPLETSENLNLNLGGIARFLDENRS